MSAPEIRRATTQDLPELKKLWWRENLDGNALAARVGEFQIVLENGKITAAIGLQVAGRQGKIHSECITDPLRADPLRALLWQRLETWAKNLGLFRLWTPLPGSFWQKTGFQPVEISITVPQEFQDDKPLYALQLGIEPPPSAAALGEFGLMREASRAKQKRFLARVEVIAVIVPALLIGSFKLWHVYHLSHIHIPSPTPARRTQPRVFIAPLPPEVVRGTNVQKINALSSETRTN